ncbi:MAG TPA: HEAT repeat domain-containing protein [Steroidobacteraceae bacterium]|jgi:HEAT repeat protein
MSLDAVRGTQIAVGALALFVVSLSPQLLGGRTRGSGEADELVRQLRGFPAWLSPDPFNVCPDAPACANSPSPPPEARRQGIYTQLHALGSDSVPALTRALVDPDVNLRQNAALALGVLGEGLAGAQLSSRMDISAALPALVLALRDRDAHVRELSEQALGDIGPGAASAVPALVELLASDAEGERISACIALHDIGPAAHAALPALRLELSDPSPDVRGFAQFAIAAVEATRAPLSN